MNSNDSNENLLEDILDLLGDKPVLLNEIIQGLRGPLPGTRVRRPTSKRRWRSVDKREIERLLRDLGAYFARRMHGSGTADYVAAEEFTTVIDGRGKVREVFSY